MIVGLYISNQQEKRGSPRLSLGHGDVEKKARTLHRDSGAEARRVRGVAFPPLACQAEGRQDSEAVSTPRHVQPLG